MAHHGFQRGITTSMPPGTGFGHVEEVWRAESVFVVGITGFPETTKVFTAIRTITLAAAHLGHSHHMELFVGQEITTVATRTARAALLLAVIKQQGATLGLIADRL